MKIIDATTYFEENLMMNLRFNILDKYVDKFIVCEGRFTHSGKEKDINFNKEDYPSFKEKIIHLIVNNEPFDIVKSDIKISTYDLRVNSIKRIKAQRNYIKTVLKEFSPNDYLIYSDNDEIPNLEDFNFDKNKDKIVIFKQKLFYYKFNLLMPNINWYGSKACKLKDLKDIDWLRNIKNKKYNFFRFDTLFSNFKYQNVNIVKKGGWHFSNLKNLEELQRKYLSDENHSEFESQNISKEKIKEHLKNKTVGYNHQAKKDSKDRFNSIKLIKVDKTNLPEFIQKNIEKYTSWID